MNLDLVLSCTAALLVPQLLTKINSLVTLTIETMGSSPIVLLPSLSLDSKAVFLNVSGGLDQIRQIWQAYQYFKFSHHDMIYLGYP
jgi:hypothetical protein